MNFENQFQYEVISHGVSFVLQSKDGEQIAKSRQLSKIAEAIVDDQGVLNAYEEGQIDFNEIDREVEELRQLVAGFKFKENYEVVED